MRRHHQTTGVGCACGTQIGVTPTPSGTSRMRRPPALASPATAATPNPRPANSPSLNSLDRPANGPGASTDAPLCEGAVSLAAAASAAAVASPGDASRADASRSSEEAPHISARGSSDGGKKRRRGKRDRRLHRTGPGCTDAAGTQVETLLDAAARRRRSTAPGGHHARQSPANSTHISTCQVVVAHLPPCHCHPLT